MLWRSKRAVASCYQNFLSMYSLLSELVHRIFIPITIDLDWMTAQIHAYLLIFGESCACAGHTKDESACAWRGSQG